MNLTRPPQVLILLLLTAIALLLLIIQPADEPALRSLAPSPVLVNPASRIDLYPRELVSGHLQPVRRAWLRFEVDGRVAERRVEAGQSVSVGDVLLTLGDQDYQDKLIQAQAEWQQAEQDLQRDRSLLKLAERGWDRVDALVEAGRARVRPILLTTVTTFLGISPLIFFATGQTAFLSPMAVSLGFGLLFATALILIVVPCFYLIADDFRHSVSRWMRRGAGHPAHGMSYHAVVSLLDHVANTSIKEIKPLRTLRTRRTRQLEN